MVEVFEHALRERFDGDFARVDAERVHQRPGVRLGSVAGGEAGHGDADDILARQARRSKARAMTMRACVELMPPETPMTTRFEPVVSMRLARPETWML